MFKIPLDFDFFKHPIYRYRLKEDITVNLELNSSEKSILCSRDTTATYKLSGNFLEYDAVFAKLYAATIVEPYTGTTLIPFTKVT